MSGLLGRDVRRGLRAEVPRESAPAIRRRVGVMATGKERETTRQRMRLAARLGRFRLLRAPPTHPPSHRMLLGQRVRSARRMVSISAILSIKPPDAYALLRKHDGTTCPLPSPR